MSRAGPDTRATRTSSRPDKGSKKPERAQVVQKRSLASNFTQHSTLSTSAGCHNYVRIFFGIFFGILQFTRSYETLDELTRFIRNDSCTPSLDLSLPITHHSVDQAQTGDTRVPR